MKFYSICFKFVFRCLKCQENATTQWKFLIKNCWKVLLLARQRRWWNVEVVQLTCIVSRWKSYWKSMVISFKACQCHWRVFRSKKILRGKLFCDFKTVRWYNYNHRLICNVPRHVLPLSSRLVTDVSPVNFEEFIKGAPYRFLL